MNGGEVEVFGQLPDGRSVERITLRSGSLTARFLTWGAVLQDLRLAGHDFSLVLGLSTLEDYLQHSKYFGATAGRCANRIGNARFVLDGVAHEIDPNFIDKHHLHGGSDSCGKRLWEIGDFQTNSLELMHVLPDGHMGYPGQMRIRARFTLEGDALDIRYSAESDAPTLCNLAHHSYWVLDGSGTILDHELQVSAETFTEIDDELIPTGQTPPVTGTHLDFRTASIVRPHSEAALIDHNFCVSESQKTLRTVACLKSETSGISLNVQTTEPGLQVYDSGPMDVPILDIDGRALKAHAGMALEPQIWPDAINHDHFPNVVLRPGETYEQHTRFEIAKG